MNLKFVAIGIGVILLLGGVVGAASVPVGGVQGTVESPACGAAVSGTVEVVGGEAYQGCETGNTEPAGQVMEDAGFQDQMQELMQNNEWDKALTLADQKKADMAAEAEADYDLLRFLILVLKKDGAAVHAQAVKLGEKHMHNASLLNEIAWQIATADGLGNRDLVLAEKLAARANELTESGDATIFDTLARIEFLKGDKEEAISLQQQAINNATEEQAEELKKTLESYTNGKLPPADESGSVTDALKNRIAALLAKSEENREETNRNDEGEAGGDGADPNHYVQAVVLPKDGTVVVATGEFETESQGSYSVRLYAPETGKNRFAKLVDGIICKRENGFVDDVLVETLAGDKQDEIVVVIRNPEKNDALSADAFRIVDGKIQRRVSVANQDANADIVKLLAFKLKPADPGTPGWFTAVEAAVCVLDDEGHGPTVGSREWLDAVDHKLFPVPAAGDNKTAVGSKKWCKAVDKALFAGMR